MTFREPRRVGGQKNAGGNLPDAETRADAGHFRKFGPAVLQCRGYLAFKGQKSYHGGGKAGGAEKGGGLRVFP